MASVILHRLPADVAKASRDHIDYMRKTLLSRIYEARQKPATSVRPIPSNINSS